MRIGVPKETKEGERRVGLLPAHIAALCGDGHACVVEHGAGAGLGIDDTAFAAAGARLGPVAKAWDCDLVVKVKELQPADLPHVSAASAIFGFQHLVGEPALTRALAATGASAIAYELVRDREGRFPLLAPMSVIAGRMAIEAGARLLGRALRRVLILGAGNAGLEAARRALREGAEVTLLTRSPRSRDAARALLGDRIACELAEPTAIARHAVVADLVVGAVFQPGMPTPKLLPRALVARMPPGSVIVDVSIDAGGAAETSRPTTHAEPSYVEEGVVHCAIANLPAADPLAAAAALAQAALPYVRALAGRGIEAALREDPGLAAGVVVWKGHVTHPRIAKDAGLPYTLAFAAASPGFPVE